MSFIDRNAANLPRLRRNAQRSRIGDITSSVKTTAPIKSGSSISLTLLAAGGLQVASSALSLKLADTSLALSASGVAVNLAATPGLQVSSGLKVLIDGSGSGLSVTGSGVKYTSPVTTKGDVLTFSTVPTRQAVGANDNLLAADSTQTAGLRWTRDLKLNTLDLSGNVTSDTKSLRWVFNGTDHAHIQYANDGASGVGVPNRDGLYMVNLTSGFYLQIDDAAGSLVYGPNNASHVFAVYTTGTIEVNGQPGLTDSFLTGDGRTAGFTGGILTSLA